MLFLVYDVETLNLPNSPEQWEVPWELGFGTAVAYHMDKDVYHFFGPSDVEKFKGLLTNVGNAITFNGKRFDDKVVMGSASLPTWKDLDLFEVMVEHKFGMSLEEAKDTIPGQLFDGTLSLKSLSMGTLGRGKFDEGSRAPNLIHQCRWAEVYAYNLDDVRLTKMLYNSIMNGDTIVDKRGNEYKDVRDTLERVWGRQ